MTGTTFEDLCVELGVSVRTMTMLERAGVRTRLALQNADLWKLHVAGAGKLVLHEVRAVQTKLEGQGVAVLSREAILEEVTDPTVTVEVVRSIVERFTAVGWEAAGPDRWKFFNRNESAIIHATVVSGQRALWLELNQRDDGLRTVWSSSGPLAELAGKLVENQQALSYLGIARVAHALAPQIRSAWLETRGGYLLATPR